MFGIITDILSSVLAGGATGIIGVIAQRVADYKNKRLDLEFLAAQQKHELELSTKIYDNNLALATQNKEAVDRQQQEETLRKSYNLEPKSYVAQMHTENYPVSTIIMFAILDVLRGIVRPLLTIYLCVLTTLIYYHAYHLYDSSTIESQDVKSILETIINTILYLTTTCVLWWFGTRNKKM